MVADWVGIMMVSNAAILGFQLHKVVVGAVRYLDGFAHLLKIKLLRAEPGVYGEGSECVINILDEADLLVGTRYGGA